MIGQQSLLVTLVELPVDRVPVPPPPAEKKRGRPRVYTDRLFLEAWVVMLVRHLRTVDELLNVPAQPTPEMRSLHLLFSERDKSPARRTWERRLKALPVPCPLR